MRLMFVAAAALTAATVMPATGHANTGPGDCFGVSICQFAGIYHPQGQFFSVTVDAVGGQNSRIYWYIEDSDGHTRCSSNEAGTSMVDDPPRTFNCQRTMPSAWYHMSAQAPGAHEWHISAG
jgi:hypothetical protein